MKLCANSDALLLRLLHGVIAPIGSCVVAVCLVLRLWLLLLFSAMYVEFVGRHCNVTCASNANAGLLLGCCRVAAASAVVGAVVVVVVVVVLVVVVV